MSHNLDSLLAEFRPDDYTVRLAVGLTGLLPFTPELTHQPTIEAAAASADPVEAAHTAAAARQLALGEGPQAALATANLLDKGDRGVALFSGLAGLFRAFKKSGDALETDPQQVADAAFKALGLSWMAWKLYPGTAADKARLLWASKSGAALLGYYAAIEVALPFTDNVLAEGAGFFKGMVEKSAVSNAGRLSSVGDGNEALAFLRTITDRVGEMTAEAAKRVEPITQTASQHLPAVAGAADKMAGVVATAADSMDSYRYLGAQMVVEECVRQAREAR